MNEIANLVAYAVLAALVVLLLVSIFRVLREY
jgi:hypothetical protein